MTDPVCSIDGCDNPIKARGWCRAHYNRWHRWGDPTGTSTRKPGPKPTPIEERFWAKVIKGAPDDCWEWTGYRNHGGYGQFSVGPKTIVRAHRFSWEWANGCEVAEGMVVHHRCENPPCVNPAHLEVVTRRENTVDLGIDNAAATNARKTHCANGHEFTPENTIIRAKGGRKCRACKNLARRKGPR